MGEGFLTADDVRRIPATDLPLIVLSDNLRSFFSWGIKVHENGFYNHFMWMHKPQTVASQDATYRETPIDPYLKSCRLKFWHNPDWNGAGEILLYQINRELSEVKGKWAAWYDWLQIIGKLFRCDWIQIPGREICSDKSKYLKAVDPDFKRDFAGRHPSPSDINRWLKCNPKYKVYGRYVPD